MKKSDLKTGMIVTLRNGDEHMVFMDSASIYCDNYRFSNDVIVNLNRMGSWEELPQYDDDLKIIDEGRSDFDIVKVEKVDHPYAFIYGVHRSDRREILFKL